MDPPIEEEKEAEKAAKYARIRAEIAQMQEVHGPRFFENPEGYMVNERNERVDPFGRTTKPRGVAGKDRPSKTRWRAAHQGETGASSSKGGWSGGWGQDMNMYLSTDFSRGCDNLEDTTGCHTT